MDNKASDLSARLLATENLSVVRARTRTASFDIKSRVLTLPLWKDMTPEIEDMLVGHEVGHALFTSEEYLEPIKQNNKMMSYLNVLEDVRIEKHIKKKYPGLRKRMNEGYRQLNERDFFGVKQIQDLDTLLLIDKINLYFKAGYNCGVKFTPEEKEFVNRAEKTETVDEIIQLAQDIYAFSKEKLEEQKKQQASAPSEVEEVEEPDLDDSEEFDDTDMESQEDQEVEQEIKKAKPPESNEATDDELESKTEKSFTKQLEDLADESTEYFYHNFDTTFIYEPVIGYRRILSETRDSWAEEGYSNYDAEIEHDKQREQEYQTFKNESMRTVNYLVKEFEMKKSASLHKRAQTAKMGSLDMRKVWSYKLNDDLFKRVTVLPQGKNHGMLFLLDWSGSMDSVIEDTLKQVINLAMFCNRIQIPYRVLAFTSQYSEVSKMGQKDYDQYREKRMEKSQAMAQSEKNLLTNASGFHLLEFFSNKMTSTEFNAMAKRVLDPRFRWNDNYSMGGTPLNEALAWVYLNLESYIKSNSIEKMTLITLTDGEGNNLHSMAKEHVGLSASRSEYTGNGYKKISQRHFIRDEYTQKTYEITSNGNVQTESILRMIKDRYQIAVLGFYICRNSRHHLAWAINSNLPSFAGDSYTLIEKWRKDFRDHGFTSIKNTGRDDLFLIPQTSTKIQEGSLVIGGDMNAKSIAKNFSKFLNVKKTSRVLLNRFVAHVA